MEKLYRREGAVSIGAAVTAAVADLTESAGRADLEDEGRGREVAYGRDREGKIIST